MIVRVETPRWVAGMIVKDGVIVECAPVLRRKFFGKSWIAARDILINLKSYEFYIIEPEGDDDEP